MCCRRTWIGCGLLYAVASWGTPAAETGPTFADCEAQIRSAPDTFEGYDCIAGVPRANQRWDEARRRLEGYVSVDPDNQLARFALGALESSQGRDRAESLLLEAIDGLERQGRQVEHVRARLTLAVFYLIRGRDPDAELHLAAAAAAAQSVDDPLLLARVLNIQGRAAERRNELSRAWHLFKEVEANIVPDGPPGMQGFCLAMLGILSGRLGRLDDAIEYHGRAADVQHASGDLWAEARSRGNVARHSVQQWSDRRLERDEALPVVRRALETAIAAGARSTEGRLRADLSLLLDEDEALVELQQSLAIARELRDALGTGRALRYMALMRSGMDDRSRRSLESVEEALELARGRGDRSEVARALMVRSALYAGQGRSDPAIADLARAADEVELLRDLQKDDVIQARLFSQSVPIYQRWAGLLLTDDSRVTGAEEAFAVGERMRARALLDALDAARATPSPVGELAQQREALLEEIGRVQRELIEGEGRPAAELLAELERLEHDELGLREELAREDPAFRQLRSPEFPTAAQVRAALGADEALLLFQIGAGASRSPAISHGPDGGGSWLLVLTSDSMQVHPLPDRPELTPALRAFTGLLGRRDGAEADAAVLLHESLLAEGLSGLPAEVRHLILVPDGPLHHLPFGALRDAADASALGLRYRLSRVPSATTWWKWRTAAKRDARRATLVLADPVAGAGARADDRGEGLGPLPHARDEARLLKKRLGDDVELLLGPAASEAHVKRGELQRYGLLHFAAHAVVDDDNPARSAVLLSPGGEDQDGLLQSREVVRLGLDGAVVVLSACRSASGAVVDGEGVMGLARAFFQAGAHVVVGSLWPLRDDDAEAFFGPFYRELARGRSVNEALRAARRERASAGAPAAAWSGVVVLGQGELAPWPGGVGWRPTGALGLGISAAMLLAAFVLVVLTLRRWSRAASNQARRHGE